MAEALAERDGLQRLVRGDEAVSAGDRPPESAPGAPDPLWTSLVEQHLGWLRAWLRGRVRDPEVVHDVCQESMLKALRSRNALRDVSRFPAWLYQIANNTLRDHLRRSVRRRKRLQFTDDLEALDAPRTAAPGLAEAEEAERLLAEVRALPPKYREPLLLRHSQDLPYAEIARILGITENAVQVRIFRARKMLRQRVDKPEPRNEGRDPGEDVERRRP